MIAKILNGITNLIGCYDELFSKNDYPTGANSIHCPQYGDDPNINQKTQNLENFNPN